MNLEVHIGVAFRSGKGFHLELAHNPLIKVGVRNCRIGRSLSPPVFVSIGAVHLSIATIWVNWISIFFGSYTHACTHAHIHARMHARTQTHTQTHTTLLTCTAGNELQQCFQNTLCSISCLFYASGVLALHNCMPILTK